MKIMGGSRRHNETKFIWTSSFVFSSLTKAHRTKIILFNFIYVLVYGKINNSKEVFMVLFGAKFEYSRIEYLTKNLD